MSSAISFIFDDRVVSIDFKDPSAGLRPTTTVLNYLRSLPDRKGTKEGCAEGDCGACTVALGEVIDGKICYRAVDSCLVFLPMLHGRQLLTVESLQSADGSLHPVQQAMVETGGSQCGYCTPGFIMSMFSLYEHSHSPSRAEIDDALTGNLCRCTGYRPIVEAAAQACANENVKRFSQDGIETVRLLRSLPKHSVAIATKDQRYWKPATLKEALQLRRERPSALIISGATDIALRVTKKHEVLSEVIDLSDVNELKQITVRPNEISFGAGAVLTDVLTTATNQLPALSSMLAVFGSRQIRNLATLGGNLGTASPIGDTLPVLMAYNAKIVLESMDGRREVPMEQFITGYRQTVRKPDELITAVIVQKPSPNVSVRSYKISKRKDLDISTVSAGFRLELDSSNQIQSILLAYGGMAERTKRAARTEEFLKGKRWDRSTVEQAMAMIEKDFTPISDARAGAEMRVVAARNLLLKFWWETSNG